MDQQTVNWETVVGVGCRCEGGMRRAIFGRGGVEASGPRRRRGWGGGGGVREGEGLSVKISGSGSVMT